MKFLLYISLCSVASNTCLEPIKYEEVFNDWNTCVVTALDISKKVMKVLDLEDINKFKLSTQYSCEEVHEI